MKKRSVSTDIFLNAFLESSVSEVTILREKDQFLLFQESTKTHTTPKGMPAVPSGFLVGFISYDWARNALGVHGKMDDSTPSFLFREYEYALSTDAKELFKTLPHFLKERSYSLGKFVHDFPTQAWEEGFQKTHHDIFRGEFYQINLTQRFTADFWGDTKQLFLAMILKNPSSQAGFFGLETGAILSASPELFLRFYQDTVTTEPIKGTRPRGKSLQEDEMLQKELLQSKKEKAELLMIADLLRNDLRKTCRSIRVSSLRSIQKNPSVWHTFSRISGKKSPEYSAIETLLSCLPGGSISGCPKKRAVEIIEEVEPHARGIFCGTLGFLDSKGNGAFSLLIRTILLYKNRAFFQAGGGITSASEQEAEREEILQKSVSFFALHKEQKT